MPWCETTSASRSGCAPITRSRFAPIVSPSRGAPQLPLTYDNVVISTACSSMLGERLALWWLRALVVGSGPLLCTWWGSFRLEGGDHSVSKIAPMVFHDCGRVERTRSAMAVPSAIQARHSQGTTL